MIPHIVRNTPEIEKIVIHHLNKSNFDKSGSLKVEGYKGIWELANLTKLKSLELHCGQIQVVPILEKLMAAQIPLGSLQLYCLHKCNMNSEFADAISQFGQLKKLGISFARRSFDDEFVQTHLIPILKRLDGVTVLKIRRFQSQRTDAFNIVRNAPNLKKIKCLGSLERIISSPINMNWFRQMLDIVVERGQNVPLIWSFRQDERIDVPMQQRIAYQDIIRIEPHVPEIRRCFC